MLVSAILIAILLAGGYALYLWLRQQRGGRDPMPGRRSLTPERDKNIQPIELTSKRKNNRPIDPLASLPGGSDELLQPRPSRPDPSGRHDPMRTEQMAAPPAMTGALPAVGQRTASSASHPAPGARDDSGAG